MLVERAFARGARSDASIRGDACVAAGRARLRGCCAHELTRRTTPTPHPPQTHRRDVRRACLAGRSASLAIPPTAPPRSEKDCRCALRSQADDKPNRAFDPDLGLRVGRALSAPAARHTTDPEIDGPRHPTRRARQRARSPRGGVLRSVQDQRLRSTPARTAAGSTCPSSEARQITWSFGVFGFDAQHSSLVPSPDLVPDQLAVAPVRVSASDPAPTRVVVGSWCAAAHAPA